MSFRLEFVLDNGDVQPPINSKNIGIKFDFTDRGPNSRGTVKLLNFDFALESSKIINADKERAKDGTRSIYEGTPLGVALIDGNRRLVLIDGFVDKASNQTIYACDRIKAQIRESGSKEWLEEGREDGFSFQILFDRGIITRDDFIYMPYIINTIPDDWQRAFILGMIFSIALEFRRTVRELIELFIEVGGIFTTVPALIKLGLYIAYLIILFITIVKLVIDMVNVTIQPVKYHACMKIKTLAEKGAQFLEMDFESTKFDDEFWEKTVIMPEKSGGFSDPVASLLSFLRGVQAPFDPSQKGFPSGTYGDFLEQLRVLWNAKKIVKDGVIRMERRDFEEGEPTLTLPPVQLLEHTTNANEIKAYKIVRFATDAQDRNTVDQLKGTIAEIVTSIKTVTNPFNVRLPGKEEINSAYCLGKRKTDFTKVELFLKNILNQLTPFIGAIESAGRLLGIRDIRIADFTQLIDNRLGMLILSDDATGVPKIFAINEGTTPRTTNLNPDNETRLSGKGIYLESYQIDSHVTTPDNPFANQYTQYKIPEFNFCFDDFISLKNTRRIFMADESVAEVVTAEIMAESGLVKEMTIRVNEDHDNTLIETINEPDGL